MHDEVADEFACFAGAGSPVIEVRSCAGRSGLDIARCRGCVAVADAHGIACEGPSVLADGYSTVVRLAPAPVVARVPTIYSLIRVGEMWRKRELDVVMYLHAVGIPVVPPCDVLPPGRIGMTVSW